MEPFGRVAGRYFRLDKANVDTDTIIAAEWMKTLTRAGLGRHAFARSRGANSTFDEPLLQGAPILLAGENFGCGSSREHAVWAMKDMGLKVVIAQSFSDIFAGNALRNGMLPITLPAGTLEHLSREPLTARLIINLLAQTVTLEPLFEQRFEIEPAWKEKLLEGIDEIGATLALEESIHRHEANDLTAAPFWQRFGKSTISRGPTHGPL